MEHKGTVRLETERLILRRHEICDAEIMFKNWVTDKEVTKYLIWQPHKDVEETRQILQEWVDSYEKNDFYFWTIELKSTHELVGDISVVNLDEETESLELGYGIGKVMQKMGMKQDGIIRQSHRCNQGIVDCVYYSILQSEYKK